MVSLTDLVQFLFMYLNLVIYKKFPGGGGNSPQFPAIPVVVRGRRDILSVLEVFSGRLRELSVHRSIQNVLAAPGTPHPPTQALAYYNTVMDLWRCFGISNGTSFTVSC